MQLSGNKVKHGEDSNVLLSQRGDGKKKVALGFGGSDQPESEHC